jgi:hemerythrin-like domain-containing protein
MRPTEVLVAEHDVIEQAIAALNGAGERLLAGDHVPASFFLEAVDFVRNYADLRHHGKEEALLFPALEQHGIRNEGGPVGVMLTEHVIGRQLVAELETAARKYEAGDDSARAQIASASRQYAQLLSAHIYKENNILFMMADQVLDSPAQTELRARFETVDAREEFAQKRDYYEHWAAEQVRLYASPVRA